MKSNPVFDAIHGWHFQQLSFNEFALFNTLMTISVPTAESKLYLEVKITNHFADFNNLIHTNQQANASPFIQPATFSADDCLPFCSTLSLTLVQAITFISVR